MADGLRLGAALFNADHARLADEVARVEEAGLDFLHLDVFDGRLVPGLAFPPCTLAALRPRTRLPFEVHLVAADPASWMEELADAGADLVLLQAEGAPMLYEALRAARSRGLRAGVALALATPLTVVEAALPFVDAVLLLARVTGEAPGGGAFDDRVLPRVEEACRLVARAGVELQVAGGLGRASVPRVVAAGARTLALGGGLFRASDLAAEVRELRRLAAGQVAG